MICAITPGPNAWWPAGTRIEVLEPAGHPVRR